MDRILLVASTPLANDGLTKIEMDVLDYNKGVIQFEVACGFGFDNEYGDKLQNAGIVCRPLPHKRNVLAYMNTIYKLVKKEIYDSVYIHGNSAMMFMEAIPSKLAGLLCFAIPRSKIFPSAPTWRDKYMSSLGIQYFLWVATMYAQHIMRRIRMLQEKFCWKSIRYMLRHLMRR